MAILGRNTEDITQWTYRLTRHWSRRIWCCLPSKSCTIWHRCLQRTCWCSETWRSVFNTLYCSLVRLHLEADEVNALL